MQMGMVCICYRRGHPCSTYAKNNVFYPPPLGRILYRGPPPSIVRREEVIEQLVQRCAVITPTVGCVA